MRYMRYQKFIQTVKEHIKQVLQKEVYVQPVLKNNGTIYDGLIILDPLLNISPTIYLNSYYQQYISGTSMDTIYEDILTIYKENLPADDFDISIFCDYEKAKERIIMKLIHAEKNQKLLKQVPHILIYDLAIVFLCNIDSEMQSFSTILIYNHHLNMWNISAADLYEVAKENSLKLLPPRMEYLHDVFHKISDESLNFLEELNLCILSNPYKIFGATSMIYPNVLKDIANAFEDDVLIIPSSVHEVILFPKEKLPAGYSTEHMNNMINAVNENELSDMEVLSDHLYCYHRDTGEMTY